LLIPGYDAPATNILESKNDIALSELLIFRRYDEDQGVALICLILPFQGSKLFLSASTYFTNLFPPLKIYHIRDFLPYVIPPNYFSESII
jgi:hypothetical protein